MTSGKKMRQRFFKATKKFFSGEVPPPLATFRGKFYTKTEILVIVTS